MHDIICHIAASSSIMHVDISELMTVLALNWVRQDGYMNFVMMVWRWLPVSHHGGELIFISVLKSKGGLRASTKIVNR